MGKVGKVLKPMFRIGILPPGRLFLFGFLDGYGESLVEAYARYVEAPVVVAKVGLGDEVVAYAPGSLGLGAYAFRVVGLVDLPETHLEARTLLVPLKDAQALLAPGRVTRLEIRLSGLGLYDLKPLEEVKASLSPHLEGLWVETWLEANPIYAALLPLYDAIMAWRNVLRQRRRTALLSLVVVYVTVAVLFLFGFLDGYGESLVEAYARYVEAPVVVAKAAWWEDPDPEHGLEDFPDLTHPWVQAHPLP